METRWSRAKGTEQGWDQPRCCSSPSLPQDDAQVFPHPGLRQQLGVSCVVKLLLRPFSVITS